MRENRARVRYSRDDMVHVLRAYGVGADRANIMADAYEVRRAQGKDMPCQSVVHHGPGHQSSTYCEMTGGEDGHDVSAEGVVTHGAQLSHGWTEWTDERPYSDEGWF